MHASAAPALAVAIPLVLATCGVIAVAAGERLGMTPLSAPAPRSSAEAAAAGDAAAMFRLLLLGDHPTRVYPIRPGLTSPPVSFATTVEAALWARSIELVKALDRDGAIVGSDERDRLACLAADLSLPHIAAHLSPGRSCVPGATIQRVMARSSASADLR